MGETEFFSFRPSSLPKTSKNSPPGATAASRFRLIQTEGDAPFLSVDI